MSVCVARVPLDVVTSFATRTVTARDYCLVRVRSDTGQAGIGFCYVGSAGGRIAQMVVAELLAPKLIGQNSLRVEGLWQELYAESLLHGRAGTGMRALSIVDTALWDLNARTAGLPLYAYLGAVVTDRVPAYASGGYYLDGKTPDMLGDELASYVKSGFRAVKIKVGRLSPAQEEERMAAARDAVGPDVLLMLDANNAWRDLPTAMAYMDRYERYDPTGSKSRSARTKSTCMRGSRARSRRPWPLARSAMGGGTSRNCSTKAPPRFCRPMPPSAAAFRNGVALRRPRRATV